jgi:signal transduction histidine kinase
MRDATGVLVGFSTVLRDVTERLRTEAELAAARITREVLADRDRMARDLHDRVIQRIFGAALTLQGAASLAGHPGMAVRIEAVIHELDLSIEEIRSAIFTLQRGPQSPASLRAEILDLVANAAQALGFAPTASFSGPVDTVVPDEVAAQVLAVAREALSNIARHAHASAAEITLSADRELVLEVTDNGRGMGGTTRRSGLRNLRDRAAALGGTFDLSGAANAGTTLVWRVPLPR